MKQIKEGKMVGYKLSKNDLVAPFFVIFRSVREKLLVTVFFDHPVSISDPLFWFKQLRTSTQLQKNLRLEMHIGLKFFSFFLLHSTKILTETNQFI